MQIFMERNIDVKYFLWKSLVKDYDDKLENVQYGICGRILYWDN